MYFGVRSVTHNRLDNAGKTTLMYKMTLGSVVATAPTIGSNTETFEYKNLKFLLWDVGGQTSLRSSWAQYLTATDAVCRTHTDPAHLRRR